VKTIHEMVVNIAVLFMKISITIEVGLLGHPSRGHPKKTWKDCVKTDMRMKRVSMKMTIDRREWQNKTCCADPT
jgi:hypothetical protein